MIRVDAETYRPLEAPILVSPGNVTRVNVTLVAMVDRGSGFREHLHDHWGDDVEKVLFEETLNFEMSLASGGRTGLKWCGGGVSANGCPDKISIILPAGVIVYPGTREIAVTASWNSQYAATSSFRYMAANETKFLRAPIVMKSQETIRFPVEYPMTDHGHQTFSLWTMEILPDVRIGTSSASQGDFNRRMVGPYQVKVVALKGEVPAEPAHPMFWTNSSSLTLVSQAEKVYTGLPTPNARNAQAVTCTGSESGSGTCMALPAGVIVPPGTTRVQVVFEAIYAQPAASAAFTTKVLTFRTAKVNPREATMADLRVEAPVKKEGTKLTYELKLDTTEADAFYQKKSVWMFSFANEGREREPDFINECSTSGCGGTKFRLTVTAINDDFTPSEPV